MMLGDGIRSTEDYSEKKVGNRKVETVREMKKVDKSTGRLGMQQRRRWQREMKGLIVSCV